MHHYQSKGTRFLSEYWIISMNLPKIKDQKRSSRLKTVHTTQKSQTTLPGRGYEFGFVIDTSAIGHFPYLES